MGRPKQNNGVCKLCGAPAKVERNVRRNGAVYFYTRSVCQVCRQNAYKGRVAASFQCERCGWQGYCDRHHRDGNHANDVEANIEIICPNCHRNHHTPLTDWIVESLKSPRLDSGADLFSI